MLKDMMTGGVADQRVPSDKGRLSAEMKWSRRVDFLDQATERKRPSPLISSHKTAAVSTGSVNAIALSER